HDDDGPRRHVHDAPAHAVDRGGKARPDALRDAPLPARRDDVGLRHLRRRGGDARAEGRPRSGAGGACPGVERGGPRRYRVVAPSAPEAYAACPKRWAARERRRSASTSRSRGAAEVTSDASSSLVTRATSSIACSKAGAFACDGFCIPLTLRTYWIAASR